MGDRVEWVGPPIGPPPWPQTGERGWLVDVHPMDDIVVWDESGDLSGDFTHTPDVVWVDDRNEPGPEKWLPHDPFGRGADD